MSLRACVTSLVLTCTVAAAAGAQERPDFAGRWTSEAAPAPAPAAGARPQGRAQPAGRDMGSGWGSTITIAQDATALTVEYMFFVRGDMQPPLKFVYALDGAETKHAVRMGRGVQEQVSRAEWAGNRLVITTQQLFPHPDTGAPMSIEVKRVLSLTSPDSLTVETTRSGVLGGPSSTTTTVYRRLQ